MAANATPTLPNPTEALQQFLGLQQAQTFRAENATADTIARLTEQRGRISKILSLWGKDIHEAGVELVDGYDPAHHEATLRSLKRVLEISFASLTWDDGRVRALLPLAPSLITDHQPGTVYREVGRTVVDGLWGGDELADVRDGVRHRVLRWGELHPVARVLAPLAEARELRAPRDAAHLARLIEQHEHLKDWRTSVVRQDWEAWLAMADRLSVDEQFETMTSLVCLHLHLALLHALAFRDTSGARFNVRCFMAVEGADDLAIVKRGAYGTYAFWRDRPEESLAIVARSGLEQLASEFPDLNGTLALEATTLKAKLWLALDFEGKTRRRKQFQERLEHALQRANAGTTVRDALVATTVDVFGRGAVAEKVKQYLRTTGMGAGIVGPAGKGAFKRYVLDERGLSLLARLHAARPFEKILTREDDRRSISAFLDDVFQRYGMVLTDERDVVQTARNNGEPDRALWRLMPSADAMRRNRAQLDARLEALRLVRRYSDASAVIYVPGAGA